MIKAEVIAHSINRFNDELVSFVGTFPRIILSEAKTHRRISGLLEEVSLGVNDEVDFSKNSASSRAIPFNKMVESVTNNPFIPIAWQKEHKGMQGTEYFEGNNELFTPSGNLTARWLQARDNAVVKASELSEMGVSKQITNRLLEPFMYHTAIITTGKEALENFFSLRCSMYEHSEEIQKGYDRKFSKSKKEWLDYETLGLEKPDSKTTLEWLQINKGQAEIHMRALAEAMYEAYHESTPELLSGGEWHIPYKKEIAKSLNKNYMYERLVGIPNMALVSSVMCARVSYTVPNHDLTEWTEVKYIDKAIELATSVPLHASPFEHCAQNMSTSEYGLYTRTTPDGTDGSINIDQGWCRNFKGYIQLRHIIENILNQ